MKVQHPASPRTDCPVYACTMSMEEHWMDGEQEHEGELVVFHHDDTTGVTWAVAVEEADSLDNASTEK